MKRYAINELDFIKSFNEFIHIVLYIVLLFHVIGLQPIIILVSSYGQGFYGRTKLAVNS